MCVSHLFSYVQVHSLTIARKEKEILWDESGQKVDIIITLWDEFFTFEIQDSNLTMKKEKESMYLHQVSVNIGISSRHYW